MKQRYIKIPILVHTLTYLLTIVVFALLLGKDVFTYIAAGILLLTVGFSLSWFLKEKGGKIRQVLANAGCISVIFFEAYKILKSSFLIEDIFFFAVEGILIMLVIISFNSYFPRNLKSIQILSLIIFTCLPLFTDASNPIYLMLSILYLFIWGLIIKIRIRPKDKILPFSAVPSYLIYFLSLILALGIARIIQKSIVFKVQPSKGHVLETKKFGTPNRLYDMEASLFEITRIFVDKSPKDRKEIMQNVTFLFQESPEIDEFETANIIVGYFLQKHGPANIPGIHGIPSDDGLVDPLKKPGSGIEPWGNDTGITQKKKSVIILKKYIDLKTDFKNETARDNILDKVTSKDKTLKTKIKTSLSLNNIRRAATQKKLSSEINLLDKNIKALPLNNQTKEELREMVNDLKKWKLYSIYNDLRNSLKEGLQSADKGETAPDTSEMYGKAQDLEQDFQLKKKLRKEVSDFIKEIEEAATAPEISELYKKTESIEDSLNKAYPAQKDDFKNSLKAILEAKMELNLTASADRLDKKLPEESVSDDMGKAVKLPSPSKNALEAYKSMLSAPEIEEFLEKLKEFEKQVETNDKALDFFKSEGGKELTNSKIEIFYSKEKERTKKTLKESLISKQNVKNFMKSIDDFSSQSQRDSSEKKNEILEEIQDLATQGLFSQDIMDKLKNHLNNLSKIIKAENIIRGLAEKKKKPSPGNYYEELKELIELNIAGNKELQKEFNDLLDEMMSSPSKQETAFLMKKIEDILDEAKSKSITPSVIKGMQKKLSKLKEIKDKSFLSENISSLMSDLETLKSMKKGDEKQDLKKAIKSLEQSALKGESPDKALMKKIEDILEKAKAEDVSSSVKKTLKNTVLSPTWQIVVFPENLVLTKGKKANIKVIGLYNNSIIKDLTMEANWTFRNPSLVRIDSNGAINAIFPGQTSGIADYKGSKSSGIEIIVVEPLSPEELDLKRYLQ